MLHEVCNTEEIIVGVMALGSQSSVLQRGALHVYRLARKPWGSDGKKGILAMRTGKGMGGPL